MDQDRTDRIRRSIADQHRQTRSQRLADLENDCHRVLRHVQGLLYRIEALRRECAGDETTMRLPILPPPVPHGGPGESAGKVVRHSPGGS